MNNNYIHTERQVHIFHLRIYRQTYIDQLHPRQILVRIFKEVFVAFGFEDINMTLEMLDVLFVINS